MVEKQVAKDAEAEKGNGKSRRHMRAVIGAAVAASLVLGGTQIRKTDTSIKEMALKKSGYRMLRQEEAEPNAMLCAADGGYFVIMDLGKSIWGKCYVYKKPDYDFLSKSKLQKPI